MNSNWRNHVGDVGHASFPVVVRMMPRSDRFGPAMPARIHTTSEIAFRRDLLARHRISTSRARRICVPRAFQFPRPNNHANERRFSPRLDDLSSNTPNSFWGLNPTRGGRSETGAISLRRFRRPGRWDVGHFHGAIGAGR